MPASRRRIWGRHVNKPFARGSRHRARLQSPPVADAARGPRPSGPRHGRCATEGRHDAGTGTTRSARDRHGSHPVDRRRPEGELRSPRGADGRGARWPTFSGRASSSTRRATRAGPIATGSCSPPGTEHAPLLAASPHGLRPVARRPQVVPAVGLAHARSSRVRLDTGRRSDHRPARPGLRERGRDGDRRAPPRAKFNRPGRTIVDHHTYGIVSDGDLMEGIAAEAASLAGHLRLGKLVYPLRRQPHPARRSDVAGVDRGRGRALRRVRLARAAGEGRQRPRGDRGRRRARDAGRPPEPHRACARTSATARRTGRTRQKAHGAPLGADEVRLTKEATAGIRTRPSSCPKTCSRSFERGRRGRAPRRGRGTSARCVRGARSRASSRAPARDRRRAAAGWDAELPRYAGAKSSRRATRRRRRSRRSATALPELFGGAADLSESQPHRRQGRRRLHGRPRPAATCGSASASTRWAASRTASRITAASSRTSATFLNFSDYMRGSVRLAAISGRHVLYVWTHDSVGLGEDGPTHQPVEHYAALRAMPNLWFVRPGDPQRDAARPGRSRSSAGTARSRSRSRDRSCRRWRGQPNAPGRASSAAATCSPTRPTRCRAECRPAAATDPDRDRFRAAPGGRRGRATRRPRASRRASSACRAGSGSRRRTRRTANPCCRERSAGASRIEAGASLGWERWVGDEGAIVAIDRFGASAPAGTIFEQFGFTVDRVTDVARRVARGELTGIVPPMPAEGGHAGASGTDRSATAGTDPGHS